MSKVEYFGKSGQHLKFTVSQHGTPKGAPLQPLPESNVPGHYTANSPIEIAEGDKIVVYGPEKVLYDNDELVYEGEFVTVDEFVGVGDHALEGERSLPLKWKDWVYIFGVSPNKLREYREKKKYHFDQISPRRWTLPKHELPSEYLEKYRSIIAQNKPKAP